MTFYNAYWDESGTHSPDIITLAGYIATDRQWALFAREWDEALKKEGVNKPFHMKEFESPHGDYTEDKGGQKSAGLAFN